MVAAPAPAPALPGPAWRPWRRARLLLPLLVLCSLSAIPAVRHLACAQPAAPALPPLVQAVAGIISFTRWPTPPDAVSLCLLEPAGGAAPFLAAPVASGGLAVHPRSMALAVALAGAGLEECNAVYVGPLSLPERQVLLRRLEGLPVLTLGDASSGCTETTMFCLRAANGAVTFSTNIDMIARSGVRLSPRVLQLGRRAGAP